VAGVEAVAPPRAAEVPAPDDLQRIEGIGPKISGLLQAAGITIADPATWPEQARLAAAGRWDELEILQEELKGGRRV
jgi:predicted flap endonuclease-1-like 5' DNA nuclease